VAQALTLRPRARRQAPWPGKSGAAGWVHLGVAAVAVLAASLWLATHAHGGGIKLGVGLAIGVGLTTWFAASVRYEVTLTIFTLYLCLLDGFIKLKTNSPNATFIRDVLLAAIVLGAAARLYTARQKVRLPPFAPWVIAFVVAVLLQVANPNTLDTTKALAGVRQQLEFVPLYFLGFALLRDKVRLRNLLILIAVVAAINGIVGLYQSHLTPAQLSGWGPGYKERINGTANISGRTFQDSAGHDRVRPFGLGSDLGYAGAVGFLALPMALAFLTLGGLGKRLIPMTLLFVAAAVGVITSQGRTIVIGSVLVVVSFFFLGLAGKRAVRTLGAMAVVVMIGVVVLPAVFSGASKGTFDRYSSIKPNEVVDTAYSYRIDDLSFMVGYVTRFPLGAGLGTVGPARAFGGYIPRSNINGETEFNFLMLELGFPGLLAMTGLAIVLIGRIVRRLPRIRDPEVRTYLAGFLAPFPVLFFLGFAGPSTATPPFAPYFWLVAGVAAYWLTDASRSEQVDPEATGRRPVPALDVAGAAAATQARARGRPARAAGARRELPARAARAASWFDEPAAARQAADPVEQFSVSVCLYGGGNADALKRAVAHISASRLPVHEILVVAAETTAGTQERLAATKGLRWVDGAVTGAVGGWNMAALEATGSHVVLLRDDVRLDAGFLLAAHERWQGLAPRERHSAIFAGNEMRGSRRVQPMEQSWLGYLSRPYKRGEPLRTMVLTSSVIPTRLLTGLLLDSQLHAEYAALDLATRAVAGGAEIIACPDCVNWAAPAPRRQREDVQDEASRIHATLKRRTVTNGSMGKGTLYYATAAAHLYASELAHHGPRGVVRASRALGKARSDFGRTQG
jgi:hypothetical protein